MNAHNPVEKTAGLTVYHPQRGVEAPTPHTCTSQCDGCHTLEHCVPATHQHRDLLLCAGCHLIVTSSAEAWVL